MKRTAAFLVTALGLALATGAVAEEPKKCTEDPAECKAKIEAKLAAAGWLGVEMEKNDQKQAVVKEVVPESPAAAAGLQVGDVLLTVDGVDYYADDDESKMKVKKAWSPGNKATLGLQRDGAETQLEVEFGSFTPEMIELQVKKHMEMYHPEKGEQEAKKEATEKE